MKCDKRLAGARCHREQTALPACEHRFEGSLDCDTLVVARVLDSPVRISKLAGEWAEEELRGTVVADALPRPEANPCLRRRWEGREIGLRAGVKVVLDDAFPVSRVGEREIEQLRVPHRLLETVGRQPVLALGLDNGDGEARSNLEQVVGAKWVTPPMLAANDNDPAVSDRVLLDDLLGGPEGSGETGNDVVAAGLCLERPKCAHQLGS